MVGIFVRMEKTTVKKAGEKNKIITFVVAGICITLFDFIVYNVVILLFKWVANVLLLAACASGAFATLLAYFLHKNFTWKDRKTNRRTILYFFAWNIALVLLVRPILVWFFESIGGFYEFCFEISNWLRLPFSFDFIRSTGIYGLMSVVTMTLNFIGYEKIVFGQKINMKSVG